MDNLDALIEDLKNILAIKYRDQYYLISNNLNSIVSNNEILTNWQCFLIKNNIEYILSSNSKDINLLMNLINKDQHKLKNKIIFITECWGSKNESIAFLYLLITRENAQKLVVLGSFEN